MKRLVAVIALGLATAGCATSAPTADSSTPAPSVPMASSSTPVPPAPTEAQILALRHRAAAYWAARMAGDDKGQWELLEPRGKGRFTPQEYVAGRAGIRYLGYQVEDASIDGYFATVKVRLLFQAILPRMTRVPVQTVLMDDAWVHVGGAWYRRLDDNQAPKADP